MLLNIVLLNIVLPNTGLLSIDIFGHKKGREFRVIDTVPEVTLAPCYTLRIWCCRAVSYTFCPNNLPLLVHRDYEPRQRLNLRASTSAVQNG